MVSVTRFLLHRPGMWNVFCKVFKKSWLGNQHDCVCGIYSLSRVWLGIIDIPPVALPVDFDGMFGSGSRISGTGGFYTAED